MWYSKEYNPIQVGSIDGTDTEPHDAAIARATRSIYKPPKHLKTDPDCTLFISRLNFNTTELSLKLFFENFGSVSSIDLIRNNVTGLSQGYAFITFADSKACSQAYKHAHQATLDDHVILVDYERSRLMKNWIPRRLGGGYGGKKESGQLRFGARDRPFRDTHGKLKIDYDQKRSDNWTRKRSSDCTSHRDSSNQSRNDGSYEHRRDRPSESYRDKSSERHRDKSSERRRDHRPNRSTDYEHRKRSSERRYSDRSRSPAYKRKRIDIQDHRHYR